MVRSGKWPRSASSSRSVPSPSGRTADPQAAQPHYNLGNLYWGQKRYEAAAAAYRQAIDHQQFTGEHIVRGNLFDHHL